MNKTKCKLFMKKKTRTHELLVRVKLKVSRFKKKIILLLLLSFQLLFLIFHMAALRDTARDVLSFPLQTEKMKHNSYFVVILVTWLLDEMKDYDVMRISQEPKKNLVYLVLTRVCPLSVEVIMQADDFFFWEGEDELWVNSLN